MGRGRSERQQTGVQVAAQHLPDTRGHQAAQLLAFFQLHLAAHRTMLASREPLFFRLTDSEAEGGGCESRGTVVESASRGGELACRPLNLRLRPHMLLPGREGRVREALCSSSKFFGPHPNSSKYICVRLQLQPG